MENQSKFYKNKYFIAFYDYDEEDETCLYLFDNIKEICIFKKKKINKTNLNMVSVELYRALHRLDHSTRMLDGSPMRVYLIDKEDDEE